MLTCIAPGIAAACALWDHNLNRIIDIYASHCKDTNGDGGGSSGNGDDRVITLV